MKTLNTSSDTQARPTSAFFEKATKLLAAAPQKVITFCDDLTSDEAQALLEDMWPHKRFWGATRNSRIYAQDIKEGCAQPVELRYVVQANRFTLIDAQGRQNLIGIKDSKSVARVMFVFRKVENNAEFARAYMASGQHRPRTFVDGMMHLKEQTGSLSELRAYSAAIGKILSQFKETGSQGNTESLRRITSKEGRQEYANKYIQDYLSLKDACSEVQEHDSINLIFKSSTALATALLMFRENRDQAVTFLLGTLDPEKHDLQIGDPRLAYRAWLTKSAKGEQSLTAKVCAYCWHAFKNGQTITFSATNPMNASRARSLSKSDINQSIKSWLSTIH